MRSPEDRLLSQIDQDNPDFAAVIGIDCAGAIERRYPRFESPTAARADLRFVARRQLYV